MTKPVIIRTRFHGPPDSGNGGYSCGIIGGFIDGPSAVRLRIPSPLDVPMAVSRHDETVELFHGDELVASGRPATLDIEIPEPSGFAAAQLAVKRFLSQLFCLWS